MNGNIRKRDNEWQASVRRRRQVQWILVPVVPIVIGLGWRYPILGFAVPVVMLMGLIGAVFRGRYVCGNLCPRGAFFDRVIAPISRMGRTPLFLRQRAFRWPLLIILMGFMLYRILQNPADWRHWGRVFWGMCLVTTAVGVILGFFLRPRAWCFFCPGGTMQNIVGLLRHPLQFDGAKCKECKVCERVCPMGLPIVSWKKTGTVLERDCIQCMECAAVCPVQALSPSDTRSKSSTG